MSGSARISTRFQSAGSWLLLGVASLCVALAPVGSVGAETKTNADSARESEESSEYQRLMKSARSAYNKQRWSKAAQLYRDAAQVAPGKALVYRNLARSYFQNGDYARATTFYDHYLNLADTTATNDRIRRERKLAAHRAGDKVWTVPDSQKRVLEALREALTQGKAYTEGGGGAWALYKALLRAGYVHPDLAHLQKRLRKALIDEYEGLLVPESGQPTPALSLEQWQRQQRRLEAARALASEADVRRIIARRMQVADCGIAVVNGRFDAVLDMIGDAMEANPDMKFLRWYELVALVETEQYDRARKRLDRAREELPEAVRPYLEVLEGIVDQRSGASEGAANSYLDVLR